MTKMDRRTARLVVALRKTGFTARAVAEVFHDRSHPLHGNQGEGLEIIRDACDVLGRENDEHEDDFCRRFDVTKE